MPIPFPDGYKQFENPGSEHERNVNIQFPLDSDNRVKISDPGTANAISTLNSRAAATLASSAVFQGVGEDVSSYGRVGVSVVSDNATDGVLTMEVSRNGTDWGGPARTWADTRFAQPHMWEIVEKYFRIKYTNGTTEAQNLSLQTQYSTNGSILLGHQLNETLLDETEAIITRSVLVGKTDGGDYVNVPVNSDGQLIIDQPLSAFGSILTVQDTPIVNIDFSYNLHADFVSTRLNNGTATVDSNRMKLSTGAGANQSAQLLSVIPVKYYAGIGAKVRFTTIYSAGTANSIQIMGVGDNGDGYFFGYNGSAFGVLRRRGGNSHVQSMTVTTKSSTVENITITLDGDSTGDTVAVTNGADVTVTANEIAAHDYSNVGSGWLAIPDGAKVLFISFDAAAHADGGSQYTVTSTTDVVVSTNEDLLGVAPTDDWIAQTAWNKDRFDGTGGSGVTLDPAKGNVYQIQYQWLGFGRINFFIEHPEDGKLELCHTINYANENLLPSVNNPTLPLCALVSNGSNTSDLVMFGSSMAGFAEGEIPLAKVRHVTVLDHTFNATLAPAVTVHNGLLFQGKLNRVRVKIVSISVSVASGKDALIEVVKGATFVGSSYASFNAADSVIELDTSATALSGGEIVDAFIVSTGTTENRTAAIFIEPRQHVTIAGQEAQSGNDPITKIVVVWEEDF